MKLLLFDLDGTIMLSGGAGLAAMQAAGAALFGAHFSTEGVDVAGALDPDLFAAAARASGIPDDDDTHQRFKAAYLAELGQELERRRAQVRVMPGFPALLEELSAAADTIVGLLTGNYADAAWAKLRAAEIPAAHFEVTAFGDEAPTRPGLVALAVERCARSHQSVPAERVIVVGDTPRDVACAKENGCQVLAVATGRFDRGELMAAGAEHVVEDLSDPSPLWALLR